MTHVETDLEGDTYFPAIEPDLFELGGNRRSGGGKEKDNYPTRYAIYRRRTGDNGKFALSSEEIGPFALKGRAVIPITLWNLS